jgi:hypothetical protein
LKKYRGLFQCTLKVPNATMNLLVTDLLRSAKSDPMEDEDAYQYIKEIVQEIARPQRDDEKLKLLDNKACWPCRTPTCPRELCSIGSFYVNDRQDLFDIFSDYHNFLDFDFNASKKVADLLLTRDYDSSLSKNVVIRTESREPHSYDGDLTRDLRGRADALAKYAIVYSYWTPRFSCLR